MKTLIFILAAGIVATETHALNLVVPNDHALAQGDGGNGYPFALAYYDTQHYQQVYDASQFGVLGTHGGTINSVAFRGYAPFNRIVYSATLYLSTTTRAVDALDTNMTSNLGPDNTRVFNGLYTLNAESSSFPQPLPFDVVIPLQTGFYYNPTNGNLLLDLTVSDQPATEFAQPSVDDVASSSDSVSRAHRDPFDTHTWLDSYGAVTQFGVTPVVAPKPQILSLALSDTNLIATGNGGASGLIYCVLTSTNLAAPFASWVPVATNAFNATGNFSFTNAVDSTLPQEFFRVQIQ